MGRHALAKEADRRSRGRGRSSGRAFEPDASRQEQRHAPRTDVRTDVRTLCAAAFGAALSALVASSVDASLIASWNLNGIAAGEPPVVAASTGSGTLDCTALTPGYTVMQGTTLGALPGETAGNALAIVGTDANKSAFYFDLGAVGTRELTVSFAVRRSTTGFASNRLDYWSGFSWISFASFGASTTAWELQSHALSLGAPSTSGTLALRVVVDGATGSTGSIRFDNFAVAATPVPAPAGALTLLGLAGCVARRRRR
jgi:hypothetical protein